MTPDDTLILDPATRRNLELETNLSGGRDNTLCSVIDSSVTPMGSRRLRRWLGQPLRDRARIKHRQLAVRALLDSPLRNELRDILGGVGDIERILARVALLTARPRDLIQLRNLLGILPGLQPLLASLNAPRLAELADHIQPLPDLERLLVKALVDNPPVVIRDGGVLARGYDTELDELIGISENAGEFLTRLEAAERQRTGIQNLKVGYNRVHGYYIEIGRSHADKHLPGDYVRRQTLKATERYITPELKGFEDKALSARERALAREKQLYQALLERIGRDLAPLQRTATGLAELDVLGSFAERAEQLDLVCPTLVAEPGIRIEAGRHPVVESVAEHPFVPNDTHLDDDLRMLIVTGPNMGGKSTYMRQTALIVLLAYTGSFVPAGAARIGPVDRIFTRIGAADDLAGGRSTFMVEMTETAGILHHATAQSLVLVDEIGRGTSTFDGLSLAWAVACQLSQTLRAFTLFATHYFELTALPEQFSGMANVHLDAVEHGDGIVFMHSVKPGPASQSYGLQVAALAGIPRQVIQQARAKLLSLEQHQIAAPATHTQPDLFPPSPPDPLVDALGHLEPDELSPREALEWLYRLKALSGKAPGH